LTKFLGAVDWSDLEDRQHAVELLGHWSLVDIDDALELLSKDFRGIHEVRQYAVKRLEKATDEELQLYLLQLVQALRYEPVAHDIVPGQEEEPACTELERRQSSPLTTPALPTFRRPSEDKAPQGAALTWFLIRRAAKCQALAIYFYWFLASETEDKERGHLFESIRRQFLNALTETEENRAVKRMLERQELLKQKLLACLQCTKVMKRDRHEKKVERFREALASPASEELPLDLVAGFGEGIPLPVDPTVTLVKVAVNQCGLLKSAMVPGVIACEVRKTSDGTNGPTSIKKVMFKEGDDLRQDQLVLQLIILMDSILKKYGLDLQLTPYQVLAMSTNDGIIEFVPESTNVSAILADYNNDIMQFMRAHHPLKAGAVDPPAGGWGPQNSYGIQPEILENFIRSNAGYCVITYILGIGDRHLDNLMVTKEGRLFHIDFGFILGKDPKPFPPPMRICKEMVEGMGGSTSPGYQSFQSKCCQAYKILRRHSKLIINLLCLMTDSGIKDLSGDPMFAILKVQQKFQAAMDDEQAEEHFLSLINESVNALFPAVLEKLHRLAVAMK